MRKKIDNLKSYKKHERFCTKECITYDYRRVINKMQSYFYTQLRFTVNKKNLGTTLTVDCTSFLQWQG